jgi:hypothetical protein
MGFDQERVMVGLTKTQADGLECVICGSPLLNVAEPVGRSETGSQVFACVDCVAEAHWRQQG